MGRQAPHSTSLRAANTARFPLFRNTKSGNTAILARLNRQAGRLALSVIRERAERGSQLTGFIGSGNSSGALEAAPVRWRDGTLLVAAGNRKAAESGLRPAL